MTGGPERLPFFSVIVPTFERSAPLIRCLEGLARLNYPRDRFEVIVAVDGSGRPPEPDLARLRESLDLTVFTPPHGGPAAARNAAVERAKGGYLAFIDDDCVPAPDWLHKLAARLSAAPNSAVGGQTLNVLPNRYAAASQLLIDFLYRCYNIDSNRAHLIASNNLAVPAETFRALGGFNTTFTRPGAEDRDLCDRWRRRGCPMTFAPEVVVYHAHPMTLGAFWQQHFNYGRGSHLYYRSRSWLREKPAGLGRPSFYIRLLTYPFTQRNVEHKYSSAALFPVSQAATAAGFVWEKLASGRAGAEITRIYRKARLLQALIACGPATVGPFYVTVDLTRRCNLRCLGCIAQSPYVKNPAPYDPDVYDLDHDLFRSLSDELRAMRTQTIVLSGDGEPFLHPRLFEIIALAKGVGAEVKLFTNGTLLSEPAVQGLVDSGLDVLRVSLWASSHQEYEKNYPGTNPDQFDRVMEGLERLSSVKAARNSRRPRVILHEPIDCHNFRNIDSFVDLAIRTGCDGVSFSPLHTALGELAPFTLSASDQRTVRHSLLEARKRLRSVPIRHNINETLARYKMGEDVTGVAPCYIGWLHARIKVDGTVQACNPCRFPLGNLREQSFREIWNGLGFQCFRTQALTRRGLAEIAKDCDCSYCCHVTDSIRIHRFYKWLLPVFGPAER